MNNRRKLLIALGAGALASPLTPYAQPQTRVWRIGVLSERDEIAYVQLSNAFKAGMRELGYTENRDYVIEYRFAQNDLARLPALAAELIAQKVDLIIPSGTASAVAAHDKTREIPILIVTVGNPIGQGLAASYRHPGGNVTGLTTLNSELAAKRLDLLRQVVPGIRRVAYVYHPGDVGDASGVRNFESNCRKLGFQSIRAPVSKPEEIGKMFNQLKRDKAQGMAVSYSNSIAALRESIIEQAAKHRLPAIYGSNPFAESGGLLVYAVNGLDLYRRAAGYADKIFKGAKPGDLPIEQPARFEFTVNLKAAKALSIKIPNSILVQATKVTE